MAVVGIRCWRAPSIGCHLSSNREYNQISLSPLESSWWFGCSRESNVVGFMIMFSVYILRPLCHHSPCSTVFAGGSASIRALRSCSIPPIDTTASTIQEAVEEYLTRQTHFSIRPFTVTSLCCYIPQLTRSYCTSSLHENALVASKGSVAIVPKIGFHQQSTACPRNGLSVSTHPVSNTSPMLK